MRKYEVWQTTDIRDAAARASEHVARAVDLGDQLAADRASAEYHAAQAECLRRRRMLAADPSVYARCTDSLNWHVTQARMAESRALGLEVSRGVSV